MRNKLMMGLWRYVINVPPFLWKKKIQAGKAKFGKEFGALTEAYREIHHFVVKTLPKTGKPLSAASISRSLGVPVDRVTSALDYLEKRMTFLYRNGEGDVTWAYPVTVEPTPHRITFDTGEQLYAA